MSASAEKPQIITSVPGIENLPDNSPSRAVRVMSPAEFAAEGGQTRNVIGHPENPATKIAANREVPTQEITVKSTEWSQPQLRAFGHVAAEGQVAPPSEAEINSK